MGNRTIGVYLEGRVKWYSARSSNRYGFIEVAGRSTDVIFRFEKGRTFVERDGEAAWSDARTMREPKAGDRIVFEIDTTMHRPRAMPWGFADDFDTLKQRLARRQVA